MLKQKPRPTCVYLFKTLQDYTVTPTTEDLKKYHHRWRKYRNAQAIVHKNGWISEKFQTVVGVFSFFP